jgi:hypothetical protein
LLRVASIVICTIAIVSFLIFVVDQTKTASGHQREELTGPSQTQTHQAATQEGSLRKSVDDVANALTSPFSSLVSGISSEWTARGAKLLLTLLVYGFGLGFLARVLRVRV